MKLSAKIICYHLQKSFSIHTSRLDTFPTLSCPSCFEKSMPLQDGRVYLITDPDFQPTFHHPKNILKFIKNSVNRKVFRDDTHIWLG